MIFMTENKAKELLGQYMAAEMQGNDEEAARLEQQLNDNNWYITAGPDGTTVTKRDVNLPEIDDYLIPKESNVQPYKGSTDNTNKGLWIALGIVGAIGLTILTIYLINRYKNAHPA